VQSPRWCTPCHISEDFCLDIRLCENLGYVYVVIHRGVYCIPEHEIYVHSGTLHISTESSLSTTANMCKEMLYIDLYIDGDLFLNKPYRNNKSLYRCC
jgi:hypothetical protein